MQRALQVSSALLATLLFASCQRSYEVVVANLLSVPAVVEISQYHSEGFNGARPKDFTSNLLIETRSVSVAPNERITTVFRDGGGGFWLRWRVVTPTTDTSNTFTLDLIRDKPMIEIQAVN